METDLILSEPSYHVHHDFSYQASTWNSFSENNIAGKMEICGSCLNIGGHAHTLCTAKHYLSRVEATSASYMNQTFQDSDGN